MTERRPVTDEDRQAVRRLHAEGKSLRAIAREISRAPAVVGRLALEQDLTFDTRPTENATRAKVQDNRARRAALVASLYDLAEDDVTYLRKSGGYELTEVSAGQAVDYTVGRLPAQDRRALLGAISTAATAAVRLEQMDAGAASGSDHAVSAIGQIGAALSAAAASFRADDGDGV